jgi:hypothetical protein
MSFTAFVDESESWQDRDPGTYLLCAAVIASDMQEEFRDQMMQLKRPSQKKVHWHEELTDRGRMALVRGVASVSAEHLVVVRVGDTGTRIERRRRLCLERLCYELEQFGVDDVIVESRGPSDKLDRQLLDTMRSRRIIGPSLRLHHRPGPAEPLLWVPDVVCGAVTQDRVGNSSFIAPLRTMITTIEVS